MPARRLSRRKLFMLAIFALFLMPLVARAAYPAYARNARSSAHARRRPSTGRSWCPRLRPRASTNNCTDSARHRATARPARGLGVRRKAAFAPARAWPKRLGRLAVSYVVQVQRRSHPAIALRCCVPAFRCGASALEAPTRTSAVHRVCAGRSVAATHDRPPRSWSEKYAR